jgi:geranylgeranyl pyrophosphate synthase
MKAPAIDTSAAHARSAEGRHGLVSRLEELAAEALRGAGRVDVAHWRRAILDPALEFVARPGKQIRARLVHGTWSLAGGPGDPPEELALAIELLHAGSLIVDDIEDGSATRRGRPALHRSWGLSTALNTGNWLYFLALDLLGRSGLEEGGVPADRRAIQTLLRCHHGQALDVSIRVSELEPGEVHGVVATITSLKTASLMELAVRLAAAGAGAGEKEVLALARFGHELGVYLQMLDDLSSVTSAARRDKGAEDLALSRATWPWAWLAEELDEPAFAELQARARRVAAGEDAPTPLIAELGEAAGPVGRAAARAQIAPALEVVSDAVDAPAYLDELEADIRGWAAEFGAER